MPLNTPLAIALNEAIGCNVNPGDHPECGAYLEEVLKVCRKFYGYIPGETSQSEDSSSEGGYTVLPQTGNTVECPRCHWHFEYPS